MDAKLNQFAKVDDFSKAYILAQYPHEDKFRAASYEEFYNWLNVRLEISGIEMAPVQGGATEATATVIPNGPAGQRRKMDASPGWYSVGGVPVEATKGSIWKWFWNGSSWALVAMGELPGGNPTDEYDIETDLPLSGIAIGKGISKNFAGGENNLASAEDVKDLDNRVQDIDNGVQDIDNGVQELDNGVQDLDNRVQELDEKVQFYDRPDLENKHFIKDSANRIIDRFITERGDKDQLLPEGTSIGYVDRPDLDTVILVDRDNKYISNNGQSNKTLIPIFENIDRPDLGTFILVDRDNKYIGDSGQSFITPAPEPPEPIITNEINLQFFNPSEQEPFTIGLSSGDVRLKNYDELILDYDSLMDSVNINPNITPYISKRSIGKGVISDKDIYLYSFEPVAPKAKVLLVAGTHACEKMYIHVLRSFVRDLSINYQSHPMLEYLRWNVHIDVLPCRIPYALGNDETKRGARIVPETEPFPVSWTKSGTEVTITFNTADFPEDEYLNADTYFTEVPSSALVNKMGVGIRTSSDDVGLPLNGYRIKSVVNGRTITVTAPAGGQTSGTATMQAYVDPNRNIALPENHTSWNNYTGSLTLLADDNGVNQGFMNDKGTRPFSLKDTRRFFELVMQENYDHITDLHSPADDHYLSYSSATGFLPDLEILKEQSGSFVASPFRLLDRSLPPPSNYPVSIITELGTPMWTPEWGGSGGTKNMYNANAAQVRDAYRWFIITLANALNIVLNKKQ